MKRTVDREDKLGVLVLRGQREDQFDESSSSKVIQDLSVCSSDSVVIGSNFHKRRHEGKKTRVKVSAK